MNDLKLDVTLGSPHSSVRVMRLVFDQHTDTCTDCQPSLCWPAQTMWRRLCLTALRLHGTEPVRHLTQKGEA